MEEVETNACMVVPYKYWFLSGNQNEYTGPSSVTGKQWLQTSLRRFEGRNASNTCFRNHDIYTSEMECNGWKWKEKNVSVIES